MKFSYYGDYVFKSDSFLMIKIEIFGKNGIIVLLPILRFYSQNNFPNLKT